MTNKPFSGKQKKAQLQERRERKARKPEFNAEVVPDFSHSKRNEPAEFADVSGFDVSLPLTRENTVKKDVPKLESVFAPLTSDELEICKGISRETIVPLGPDALKVTASQVYPSDAIIDFPKRPLWLESDSKETLEAREEAYFKSWLTNLYETEKESPNGWTLSYFEHNLEVWRQLWRVIELSDIVTVVVDARHPLLHFPPSLYHYIVKERGQPLILVLNKIDLVPEEILAAWKLYLGQTFPGLRVALFSCYSTQVQGRSRVKYVSQGVLDILEACRDISIQKQGVQVDWEALIQETKSQIQSRLDRMNLRKNIRETGKSDREKSKQQARLKFRRPDDESDEDREEEDESDDEKSDTVEEDVPGQWISIGTIGHPNVGKSSLINGIVGKKVVSVSKTPGHTKHFQTIHISPQVRLCDCPGLVFPAHLPKPLQIISGMYKIAQVQEPFTTVAYLAQRIPLPDSLGLPHEGEWSGWTICEAFAELRGFHTPKGRPDAYRAANLILRMANEGRLLLIFSPPSEFFSKPRANSVGSEEASLSPLTHDFGAFALLGEE